VLHSGDSARGSGVHHGALVTACEAAACTTAHRCWLALQRGAGHPPNMALCPAVRVSTRTMGRLHARMTVWVAKGGDVSTESSPLH
jgi:hypothetical protein